MATASLRLLSQSTIVQFKRYKPSIFGAEQWRIQDFPEEGAPTPRGRQHMILPNFPKNPMELKEFGTWGGAHPSSPP